MSAQFPQPTPTPQAAPPAPTPTPDDMMSLDEVIDEVEKSSGLPKGFLRALRDNESKGGHYDEAHGGRVITSPTGPRGVFQFSRRTARQYGINPDDPTENVIGAAKYAKDNYTALKKLLPNDDEAWAAAALAHNRGLGAVQGMIRNGSLEPKGSDGYTSSDEYASNFLDNWMKYRGEQTQQNIDIPIAPNRQTDADLSPQQNLAQPQVIGARAGQTVGKQITTPTRTEVTSKILSPEDEEKALADIHPERPNLQPYDPEKGLSLPAKLARRSAESSGESLPEQMARSSVAEPSGILETVTASVPDNASPSDVVDALLDKLGPQWKALNEKYRRETGRNLMSLRNIPTPVSVEVVKDGKNTYENQVAMNPTEEFIAVAQAYAEGGVEAAQTKESEFIAKGKEDTKKQKMAVEAARETMQGFGVDPDVLSDVQTGIMKTGQGTAQLMENLRKVHEGEDPTIEDKNQQVINQSRAVMPKFKTYTGAVGGTALEVAGDVSRMQVFPYGALVEQFSENINRGGWEAAKSAGTIAALQGMGIGADKLSLLAELSPAARQVFVRAVQGDTNAALAAAQGEKGKELLKAFGIGAAFPVGSGERVERDAIAPRIAPTERTARISQLDMLDVPVRTIEGARVVKGAETPTQASQTQSKPIVEAASGKIDLMPARKPDLQTGAAEGQQAEGRLLDFRHGDDETIKDVLRKQLRANEITRKEFDRKVDELEETPSAVFRIQDDRYPLPKRSGNYWSGGAGKQMEGVSGFGNLLVASRDLLNGEDVDGLGMNYSESVKEGGGKPVLSVFAGTDLGDEAQNVNGISVEPERNTEIRFTPDEVLSAWKRAVLKEFPKDRAEVEPMDFAELNEAYQLSDFDVGAFHALREIAKSKLSDAPTSAAQPPPLQGTEAQAEVHHSQLQPRTEAGEFREETATERDARRAQMAEGVKGEEVSEGEKLAPKDWRVVGPNEQPPVGERVMPDSYRIYDGKNELLAYGDSRAEVFNQALEDEGIVPDATKKFAPPPKPEAKLSPIDQALKDWGENRAYVDGRGNYHVRAEDSSRGPVAPWNKEARAAFKDVDALHAAAQAYKQRAATPKTGEAKVLGGEGSDIRLSDVSRGARAEARTPQVGESIQARRTVPEGVSDRLSRQGDKSARIPEELPTSADTFHDIAPRITGAKERAFPKSAKGAGLEGGEERYYEGITNKATVEKAQAVINEHGADRVAAEIARRDEASADDVASGIVLMRHFTKDGDIDRAVDVASDLSKKLTKAGQTVQAASIVSRLSDEGVLIYGQRILEGKRSGAKLTNEQADTLIEAARKAREADSKIAELEKKIEELKSKAEPKPRTKLATLEERLAKIESEARARLEARKSQAQAVIAGNRQSGATTIIPDLADLATIGAVKFARKGITVADWSSEMIKEFGEEIKPHLRRLYRDSYKIYDTERKAMLEESRERSVRRDNPSVTDAREIRRLVNQKLDAQTDARKAKQGLARLYQNLGRTRLQRAGRAAVDALGMTRALETTLDLSAGLRQGKIGLARHPLIWTKAFVKQFPAMREKNYERMISELESDADYKDSKKSGLYLSSVGKESGLAGHEEAYQTSYAEKIPLVKHSERAYTMMLDQLRMGWFKNYAKGLKKMGLDIDTPEGLKAYKEGAQLINDATGRGSLGRLENSQAATLANNLFFSPRFWASRVRLLTVTPAKILTPESAGGFSRPARVEAIKTLFAFSTIVAANLAIAKQTGATVDLNPDSPDFLKGKWGRMRVDFSAGFQGHIRLALRLAKHVYETKVQGKESKTEPLEILGTYARGKESPNASLAHDIFFSRKTGGQDTPANEKGYGTDITGKPVYPFGKPNSDLSGRIKTSRFTRSLTPMIIQDAVEAYNLMGWKAGVGAAAASMFGEGVNTYVDKEPKSHRPPNPPSPPER